MKKRHRLWLILFEMKKIKTKQSKCTRTRVYDQKQYRNNVITAPVNRSREIQREQLICYPVRIIIIGKMYFLLLSVSRSKKVQWRGYYFRPTDRYVYAHTYAQRTWRVRKHKLSSSRFPSRFSDTVLRPHNVIAMTFQCTRYAFSRYICRYNVVVRMVMCAA